MKKIILFVASSLVVTVLSANQGNMDKAAEHLAKAKSYLQKAKHNKGGFRVKAINSIDRGLQQIEKGKKAADKSNKKKKTKESNKKH